MTEFLDQPLYFLGLTQSGILNPARLRIGEVRVVLLFKGEAGARAHLVNFPQDKAVTVQCAADPRAKEELFTAALAQGVVELWLDAAPDGEPALTYPLKRARDYITSFKRQSACL